MRNPDVTRNSPRNFWVYVLAVTGVLANLWVFLVLPFTEPGLIRFMAAGAFLILAYYLYGPSTLDLTGWTLAVMWMMPAGVILFVGSPIVYALWHTFVGVHVDIRVH